jgi:predicted RNase H-like nuclease (RuvC/YqgF family)
MSDLETWTNNILGIIKDFEKENKKLKDQLEELRYYIQHINKTVMDGKKENQKLREILLDAGAKTHKSKLLYDWYCQNSEKESEE